MSTHELIEEILDLSGPYTCGKARIMHRRYLEGHDTEWLLNHKKELLETNQRPAGQAALGLRYAR
jgi:hypothetical protein